MEPTLEEFKKMIEIAIAVGNVGNHGHLPHGLERQVLGCAWWVALEISEGDTFDRAFTEHGHWYAALRGDSPP